MNNLIIFCMICIIKYFVIKRWCLCPSEDVALSFRHINSCRAIHRLVVAFDSVARWIEVGDASGVRLIWPTKVAQPGRRRVRTLDT